MESFDNMTKEGKSINSEIRELEELVHRQREQAEYLVESMNGILDAIERIKQSAGLPSKGRRGGDTSPFRYLGLTMIEAIESYLQKAGGQTRERIIEEMMDGGAVEARQRPEVEVNKSIDYWLLSENEKRHKYRKRKIKIVPPRLKMVGEKIDLR